MILQAFPDVSNLFPPPPPVPTLRESLCELPDDLVLLLRDCPTLFEPETLLVDPAPSCWATTTAASDNSWMSLADQWQLYVDQCPVEPSFALEAPAVSAVCSPPSPAALPASGTLLPAILPSPFQQQQQQQQPPHTYAQCETLPGKRVSLLTPGASTRLCMSIKDLYWHMRQPSVCASLIAPAHPVFDNLDAAVGYLYVLVNVPVRKPPCIGTTRFNCHTRHDGNTSYWQYNVPQTDFTCRVTQWTETDGTVYTSYHYYRSPLVRPRTSRFAPY